MINRRGFITASLAAGVAARAGAQGAGTEIMHPLGFPQPGEVIELWPQGAPGMPETPLAEKFIERSADPRRSDLAMIGISRPRMVVFQAAQPNGAALLITPGGGYRLIVVGKEGYEFSRRPMASGITVFVLFYRLPGDGWKAGPDVALSDAQRAMRLIRHRASDFGIVPERVAAMGFSAGGHVCADLATRFAARIYDPIDAADTLSARPCIAAPIYPVMTMSTPYAHSGSREKLLGVDPSPPLERAHSPHLHVPDDAPPCFLAHAEDDETVPVENTLLFRSALRDRKISVETHLFAQGGHGFGFSSGFGKPFEAWPDLFLAWARTQNWI